MSGVAREARMLNKKEVLDRFGIAPESPDRKKIFDDLPKYDNPYSKTRIFKSTDVDDIIDGMKRLEDQAS